MKWSVEESIVLANIFLKGPERIRAVRDLLQLTLIKVLNSV